MLDQILINKCFTTILLLITFYHLTDLKWFLNKLLSLKRAGGNASGYDFKAFILESSVIIHPSCGRNTYLRLNTFQKD